jgi:Flp pilus assembly protein TadD
VLAIAIGVTTLAWSAWALSAGAAARRANALRTTEPYRSVELGRQAAALWPRMDPFVRIYADALTWRAMELADESAVPLTLEAESVARRAVALVPLRAENHFILARALGVREVLGDTTARAPARAAYQRALELAPMEARMAMEYAEHERIMGRVDHADTLLRRLTVLYPDEGSIANRLGALSLSRGRTAEARALLARSLASPWHELLEERPRARQMLDSLGP